MGLDMYLRRKHYVKNWDHMSAAEKHEVTVKKGATKSEIIKPKRVEEVVEEIMYWRKANAIHNWFVKNVQKGEDDCGDYYVSIDDLKKLLADVNEVLAASPLVEGKIKNGERMKDGKWEPIMVDGKYVANAITAHKLLPTASGFFFGSTDYDEYYIQDLKDTKEMIDAFLAEEGADEGELEYHSSW